MCSFILKIFRCLDINPKFSLGNRKKYIYIYINDPTLKERVGVGRARRGHSILCPAPPVLSRASRVDLLTVCKVWGMEKGDFQVPSSSMIVLDLKQTNKKMSIKGHEARV